jgi:hypothetical protein
MFAACFEPKHVELYDDLDHDALTPLCTPGATQSCYDGPDATAGEGPCRTGTQVCASHGNGWSQCEGQVLPVQDTCDGLDENCDGISTCGEAIWFRRYGVDRDEVIAGVDADSDSNIYVSGYYRDPIDMGVGNLTAIDGTRDMFVAKLSSAGATQWVRELFSEGAHSYMKNVAVGPDGSVVATGDVVGTLMLDGGEVIDGAASQDVLVVKLNTDGELLWWKRWGDDSSQHALDVDVDGAGNVVVAGYFRGEIDFGPGPVATTDSGTDGFVVKLAADGTHLWSQFFGGNSDEVARSIAIDGDGNVTMVGYFQGEALVADELYDSEGDRDGLVAKLDGDDGSVLWSQAFGDVRLQRTQEAVIDSADNIIFVGRTEGDVDYGGGVREVDSGGAMFVVKLDSEGGHVWSQHLAGDSDAGGYGVAVDSRDRIIITGFYEGTFSLGGSFLPEGGLGEPNVVVLKLEPNGDPVWARGVLVDGEQAASSVWRASRWVTTLGDDSIAVAGFAEGLVDFGVGGTPGFGGADVFVVKLEP